MRVLLFGSSGQVGREIVRCAGAAGASVDAVDRARCDIAMSGRVAPIIALTDCDAVINAAAFTAVDKAESEPGLAAAVNASAPEEMAAACAEKAIPLIHLSTDYVFDGAGREPYREDDAPNPLSVYAKTKRKGEMGVEKAQGAHAILRLSWVFSAHGSNFVKTMLRLADERDRLHIVADQTGKPTPAAAAASAALLVARALMDDPLRSGVYHFAGDEATDWASFAAAVFELAGKVVDIERIATTDYPAPAPRPPYSVLNTSKIEQAFGIAAPSWRDGLREVLRDLAAERREVTG